MQLVALRRVLNHRASCCCCAQDWPYVIEADDNSTQSIANYCFRCFQFLNAVTLVRSHRALS